MQTASQETGSLTMRQRTEQVVKWRMQWQYIEHHHESGGWHDRAAATSRRRNVSQWIIGD